MNLPKRRAQVLAYIKSRKIPPTRREIADHFGWRSPNSAQVHIAGLVRSGHIKVIPCSARGIVVI
jgi:repressor LexA